MTNTVRWMWIAGVCWCAGAGAVAQDDGAQEPPADSVDTQDQSNDDPLDLDALLGIDEDEDAQQDGTTMEDPTESRLERELTAQQAREELEQAVQQMDETARRIEEAGDVGLTTQRLQKDIISKLDILIEFAEQQQQQSSSQSQQQQQQQQDNQQQQVPNQQRSQAQQQQQSQQQRSGDPQEGMPPGRQDGALNPFATDSAAWGALPERYRNALLEGSSDAFSSLYRKATEEYYRRLAEEAARDE